MLKLPMLGFAEGMYLPCIGREGASENKELHGAFASHVFLRFTHKNAG